MVFTESPDDQWLVTVAGKYRLTFNTADMTFDAEFLDNAPELLPSLYMIGEATPADGASTTLPRLPPTQKTSMCGKASSKKAR